MDPDAGQHQKLGQHREPAHELRFVTRLGELTEAQGPTP